MRIFLQAPIANLAKSKLPLDDAELVLNLGPDARFSAIFGALFLRQLTVAAALSLGEILGTRCFILDGLGLSAVGRVAPHTRLIAIKQIRQNLGIVYVGGRRH